MRWTKRLMGLVGLVVLQSCGASLSGFSPGDVGATPGGAQDLALARKKVAEGAIPAVVDLPFEGLYAEHDLPIAGPTCTEALCARGGAGVAPDFASQTPSAWVQLGFSAGLPAGVPLSQLRRQALNAAIVIDNSCSMGTDKMEAAKEATRRLIDQLDERDLLTIVVFDDHSQVLVGPLPVSDKAPLLAQLAPIKASGGTCIECGLKDGLASLRLKKSADRANRLFLFTDAQPNVGATGEGEFITLLEGAAQEALYASIFGVGLDFGQALTTRISAVRGANAYFLADAERTRKVFDEDFDLLVTPVAFDLVFSMTPTSPMSMGALYGLPGESTGTFSRTVKTVFLSRKRGAIVARLDGQLPAQGPLATVKLEYQPATGGAPSTSSVVVEVPAGTAPMFSGPGTRKAVALTRMLSGLRSTCAKHAQKDTAGAIADAQAAVALIEAEASALADPALTAEVEFARKLASLLGK